jgi:hypothetical protein
VITLNDYGNHSGKDIEINQLSVWMKLPPTDIRTASAREMASKGRASNVLTAKCALIFPHLGLEPNLMRIIERFVV